MRGPRTTQLFTLALCLPLFVYLVLALAQAGSGSSCHWVFPKWFGCVLSTHETLAGGLIGATGALFAAWIAWVAVQQQINAERERMLADRTEVEQLLAGPLTESADGMAAAWRLLVAAEQAEDIRWEATREATAYMAERLSRSAEIASYRRMAETLSWDRRRRYLALIDGIEELRAFSDPHCIKEPEQVLMVIRRLADDFEYCLPKTSDCFVGLWRRAPKGMSFADHVKDRGRVPGDPLIGLEDS